MDDFSQYVADETWREIPQRLTQLVTTMLTVTYLAEVYGQLSFAALSGQIWALPFLIYLNAVDTTRINKWITWTIVTMLLGHPSGWRPSL